MNLEEKFIKYYMDKKLITKDFKKELSDLAKIAEEGREVIAEGLLEMAEHNYDTSVFINDEYLPEKLEKYHGKKVRISLEVIE